MFEGIIESAIKDYGEASSQPHDLQSKPPFMTYDSYNTSPRTTAPFMANQFAHRKDPARTEVLVTNESK